MHTVKMQNYKYNKKSLSTLSTPKKDPDKHPPICLLDSKSRNTPQPAPLPRKKSRFPFEVFTAGSVLHRKSKALATVPAPRYLSSQIHKKVPSLSHPISDFLSEDDPQPKVIGFLPHISSVDRIVPISPIAVDALMSTRADGKYCSAQIANLELLLQRDRNCSLGAGSGRNPGLAQRVTGAKRTGLSGVRLEPLAGRHASSWHNTPPLGPEQTTRRIVGSVQQGKDRIHDSKFKIETVGREKALAFVGRYSEQDLEGEDEENVANVTFGLGSPADADLKCQAEDMDTAGAKK